MDLDLSLKLKKLPNPSKSFNILLAEIKDLIMTEVVVWMLLVWSAILTLQSSAKHPTCNENITPTFSKKDNEDISVLHLVGQATINM